MIIHQQNTNTQSKIKIRKKAFCCLVQSNAPCYISCTPHKCCQTEISPQPDAFKCKRTITKRQRKLTPIQCASLYIQSGRVVINGKATVLQYRGSHQQPHWACATDGEWVLRWHGGNEGWKIKSLMYCSDWTDHRLSAASKSMRTHTHIYMPAWKILIQWKAEHATLWTRSVIPHPPQSTPLWPRLPLLFWWTVKVIIHREKTWETLDSFTLLVTDFHNSCPQPLPADHSHKARSDWEQ